MKDFIGIFFICMIVCIIVIFFFGGLILQNIWGMIILISLILAGIINAFMSQESRIEELEQKIQECSDKQQE